MTDLAKQHRAYRMAKADEHERRMQEPDICAGFFLRLNKPELPKVQPVKKRVQMNLFNAPHYHKARQHLASLSPEYRAMLEDEWK